MSTAKRRKTPTPEEIIARQKSDAVRAKSSILATSHQAPPPSVLAAPDNRNAAEKLADAVAPSVMPGPPFKFNGKEGQFEMAGSNEPLSEVTRYAALLHEMWAGRIKFNGDGEQPTRIGGLPYDGYELPARENLGDLDPDEWPAGLDGKPSDPWLEQFLVPFQNMETLEIFTFQTTSTTGRTAVGTLMRAYNRMRRANPNEVPVVQLKASSYEHRTFGRVNIHALVIVGRTTPGNPQRTDDMDDEVPF